MIELDINIVLRILQVIVFPLILWFWSRIQEQKKELAREKEKRNRLQDRVTKLEAQLENTPTKESVHQLMLGLTEMAGGVEAMKERLNGFNNTLKSNGLVMVRLEQYLLEHNK